MKQELTRQHYDRYLHFVGLAQRMQAALAGDNDWMCVAMFYAALHLMTAYLVLKANVVFDPGGAAHPDRKKAMDSCPELKDSRTKYRELKDLSEAVRYDPGFVFAAKHLSDAKSHLQKCVAIVEPKLHRLLGSS
jgi:hypothetical protein